MSDEQSPGVPPSPSDSQAQTAEDDATREFREQQAIAAALMIGQEMQRENREQFHFYAKRISMFISVLAGLGMIVLYAYARLNRDFNPLLAMLILGFVVGAGATVSYWASAESRHAKKF